MERIRPIALISLFCFLIFAAVLYLSTGTAYSSDVEVSFTVKDTTPPAKITDLVVSVSGVNFVKLVWTAPGDDGSDGCATTYDIRYSFSFINDGSQWNNAIQVAGEPEPLPAGASQSFTVSGLNVGKTYYFAVKTSDEEPNWSDLSVIASGITKTTGSGFYPSPVVTPTPTPTPQPVSPTPTPTPVSTPTQTPVLTPSPTVEPASSPEPTVQPTPSVTSGSDPQLLSIDLRDPGGFKDNSSESTLPSASSAIWKIALGLIIGLLVLVMVLLVWARRRAYP